METRIWKQLPARSSTSESTPERTMNVQLIMLYNEQSSTSKKKKVFVDLLENSSRCFETLDFCVVKRSSEGVEINNLSYECHAQ